MKTVIFFIYLLKTSLKASISKRGAFLIEASSLLASNLIFFLIWWIFFRQFNDVAGWHFNDMRMLMAVGTGGYGLMQICFGGLRNLSRMIVNGDIDPFMTQPKNLLLHIAGSRSHSKGWGHLMTAVVLMSLGAVSSLWTLAVMILSIVTSCIVFTSINIIAHSLPFWMGPLEGLSKKYCDALFLFALYPTNIYSGLLQVVMFTLIPAGIISYLPVELIRQFTWPLFMTLIVSSSAFGVIAFLVFYSGLKKYESGNRFGTRL